MSNPRTRKKIRHQHVWYYYLALTVLAIFSGFPLLMLIFNSFKSDADIGGDPLGPPHSLSLSNFISAWDQGNIGRGLLNSLVITVGTVVGAWIVVGMGAFALARLRLPGGGAMLAYMFIMIALPVQMFLVPLFFLWSRLHLYDTLPGLIVIHVALGAPFNILLLRSYLLKLPREFEEAARIDGASDWRVLRHIVIPLALPGFLTIGLIAGMGAYNDIFFASIFIQTDSKLPVSTAFLAFQQGFSQQWGMLSAAGVMIMIPFLMLFLTMQRRFVEGLTSAGLQG